MSEAQATSPDSQSESNDDGSEAENATAAPTKVPKLKIPRAKTHLDFATLLGAVFAVGLIVIAIFMGQSDANFFNVPSLLIVVLGTMAATSISYTGRELGRSGGVIGKTLMRRQMQAKPLANSLMDLAVIARKKGILAISQHDKDLKRDPFLRHSMRMVVDGYAPIDVERLLMQEIEAENERNKRAAGITRRASEVAPAMGLIGTLVGLVQMLADLENPESIGPAMAVALLTTFYGAILGTVIMAPLAVKLEKYAADETLIKTLIVQTAASIARQENPRRLEMLLNSELPASERIRYFD